MSPPMEAGFPYKYLRTPFTSVLILAAWLMYVVLFLLYLPEPWASILGFAPGLFSVGLLLWSGFSHEDCYLKRKMISGKGFVALILMFIPMVPVVYVGLTEFKSISWDWIAVLIYAPASGIAQELYFRSSLLPVFEKMLGSKVYGLLVCSLFFSLFHVGMFMVAPSGTAVSALVVTFIVGMGWGWQVQHDGTVFWAMIHHSLLQMILRLFAWM